jgi:UPF0716 protein FxsA
VAPRAASRSDGTGPRAYDAPMPLLLILAFVIVPLVELAVILQVGELIGPWWTIALLVIDSIIGAALLKREGARAWRAFRDALGEARWPGDEVTQGALVIVGGTLLLTPGFVTDGAGLLMLLPPTRAGLSRLIRARFTPMPVHAYRTARSAGARRRPPRGGPGQPQQDDVLDVEVVGIEREEHPDRPAPSLDDGDLDESGPDGPDDGPSGRDGP